MAEFVRSCRSPTTRLMPVGDHRDSNRSLGQRRTVSGDVGHEREQAELFAGVDHGRERVGRHAKISAAAGRRVPRIGLVLHPAGPSVRRRSVEVAEADHLLDVAKPRGQPNADQVGVPGGVGDAGVGQRGPPRDDGGRRPHDEVVDRQAEDVRQAISSSASRRRSPASTFASAVRSKPTRAASCAWVKPRTTRDSRTRSPISLQLAAKSIRAIFAQSAAAGPGG